MQIISENDTDIMLDEDGQPVCSYNGEASLVSGNECWFQDLKNEALTEEGELFYEDEGGDDAYGFGLLEFTQQEYDDFTALEIQQRIRSKMNKRKYIDASSVNTEVTFDSHTYNIRVRFKRVDKEKEYSFEIESDGVEVIVR